MAMVVFLPAMEWRWSLKILTITIDGSWQDQPWAAMVFPILGTNGSRWLQTEIRDKLRVNKDIKNRNGHKNLHRDSIEYANHCILQSFGANNFVTTPFFKHFEDLAG